MPSAITTRMMIVTAFERDDPLDDPCSMITFLRTNSSSSLGGTDMLHFASKCCATARHPLRRPGENRDGQAAQHRRHAERRPQSVALPDGANAERAEAD